MPVRRPYEHIEREIFKLTSDKWVVVGLFGAGIFIFFFLNGTLDSYLPQFWQGYYGDIGNPYPSLNIADMTIEIDLHSATFGALTEINTDVRVYPQDSTPDYLPSYYRIWFDESKSCLTDDPTLVNKYSCYLDLKRDIISEVVLYKGNKKIIYTHGGDFSIQLGFEDKSRNKTTIEKPFIHISNEATNTFYTFKYGTSLAIIAISLGFLNWYWKWREKHPRLATS